jgi:hypothetical protein
MIGRCSLAVLAWVVAGAPALAHRLDEYLQATLVEIRAEEIRLRINFVPGVEVAAKVLALIDRDSDGDISAREADAYTSLLKNDLTLQVDDRTIELRVSSSDFPKPAELRTGAGVIQVELTAAPGPLPEGAHTLTFVNRHVPERSVYLFNAVKPQFTSVEIAAQKRNGNQSTGRIEFRLHAE